MNPLHIEIPGSPVPKQRPRHARRYGNVITFTPKKTVEFEKHVKVAAAAALLQWRLENGNAWPTDRRYSVDLFFFFPDKRNRDLDNCVKSVTDALNKAAYDDDRQIDELHAIRDYDKHNPRTVAVIRVL